MALWCELYPHCSSFLQITFYSTELDDQNLIDAHTCVSYSFAFKAIYQWQSLRGKTKSKIKCSLNERQQMYLFPRAAITKQGCSLGEIKKKCIPSYFWKLEVQIKMSAGTSASEILGRILLCLFLASGGSHRSLLLYHSHICITSQGHSFMYLCLHMAFSSHKDTGHTGLGIPPSSSMTTSWLHLQRLYFQIS